MNLSFSRKRFQLFFEGLFPSPLANSSRKHQIINYKLTSENVADQIKFLRYDSKDYYFNGLISLVEGLDNASSRRYSWATVKLYYSYYYFLRAELSATGLGVARDERKLYYLEASAGSSPKPCGGNDHNDIATLHENMRSSDYINSQSIGGKMPHQWLRSKRELINYRTSRFPEPEIASFWETFDQNMNNDLFESILSKYLTKDSQYWYIEDEAVLALPLKRFLLTKLILDSEKISTGLKSSETKFIEDNYPIQIIDILDIR